MGRGFGPGPWAWKVASPEGPESLETLRPHRRCTGVGQVTGLPGPGARIEVIGGERHEMEKALKLLREAGYDAYIEYGHLYYRPTEGGVVEVSNQAGLDLLIQRASDRS